MPAKSAQPERPFAFHRRQADLDLHRAATRLGISPRYLRQLETAKAPLSPCLAARMSIEYGVTIQALTTPHGADRAGEGRGGERKHYPCPSGVIRPGEVRTSEPQEMP